MKDLLFKIIIIILILVICIIVTINIFVNIRYINISKTDSSEVLKDYYKYNILNEVVIKYNKYILEENFNILSKITLFDGKKDKIFYGKIKSDVNLIEESIIKLVEIKVLSSDLYKCNYSIVSKDKTTDISIVVKLNEKTSSYRIINVLL